MSEAAQADYATPFAGLRVLDFSQGYAGPSCAMMLALQGADVIKVEPAAGDWARGLGPAYGDHTALDIAANVGKRGLALDLKNPDGLEAALRLVDGTDVFIESFRPGVAERLGLGYSALAARNPRLLYLSVSGFGHRGPYAGRPCTDTVAQSFSGITDSNRGSDGTPAKVPFIVVDAASGLYAFQALAAALYARRDLDHGRHIDVSLAASAAALQGYRIADHVLEGRVVETLNAPAGVYRTADGWITVTLVTEAQYRALCGIIGRPDLATHPDYGDFKQRAARKPALMAEIQAALETANTETWIARLAEADVLADRVNTYGDWLADPHTVATDGAPAIDQPGLTGLRLPAIPGLGRPMAEAAGPAPAIGQHSADILREAGYTPEAIARLVETGAVTLASP